MQSRGAICWRRTACLGWWGLPALTSCHCPFPFAIKWLAQQSYIVMTCLLKLDIVSCIYCLHHGKIQMLRSRPPAATLYKFTEEALGLVLDGFLMGRFEVTSSWHTSTEAEILCLTTRDWKSSPYYRSKSQKVNSERYSHLHRKKKKKKKAQAVEIRAWLTFITFNVNHTERSLQLCKERKHQQQLAKRPQLINLPVSFFEDTAISIALPLLPKLLTT